jgi:hypothetical protein
MLFGFASNDVASRRSGRTAVWGLALTSTASFTPTVRVNGSTPRVLLLPSAYSPCRVLCFKHAHYRPSQHQRRTTARRCQQKATMHCPHFDVTHLLSWRSSSHCSSPVTCHIKQEAMQYRLIKTRSFGISGAEYLQTVHQQWSTRV